MIQMLDRNGDVIGVLLDRNAIDRYIENHLDKVVLSYDTRPWRVVKLKDGRYFYQDPSAQEDSTTEVIPIAKLDYSVSSNVINNNNIDLDSLFNSFCSGEVVLDDCIQYLWFQGVNYKSGLSYLDRYLHTI